jgi:hypothetical protein
MKVKAKFQNGKFGFYGGVRRKDGDEFEITDPKHFSEKWMEKVDEVKRARKPKTEVSDEGAE